MRYRDEMEGDTKDEREFTFDPTTESVNVVVTSAIDGSGSPGRGRGGQRFDPDR